MNDYEDIDGLPMLRRQMIYDMFPCDEISEILTDVGLVPSGDDVFEMEHKESRDRQDKINSLVIPAEIYITVANDLMAEALMVGVDAEQKEGFKSMSLEISRSIVFATLVQMVDTGIITIN